MEADAEGPCPTESPHGLRPSAHGVPEDGAPFEDPARAGLGGGAGTTPEERVLALLPPTRQLVLRVVRDHPGVCLGQLRKATGVAWGSLAYQLHRLEEAGLVRIERADQPTRVFLEPLSSPTEARLVGSVLLGQGPAARLAATVCAHPGRDAETLAAILDVAPRPLRHELRRLLASGLVTSHRSAPSDRHEDVRPTARLRAALDAGAD